MIKILRFLGWLLGFGVPKSWGCEHERNEKGMTEETIGVTLNWAFAPTRMIRWGGTCIKCGEYYTTQGILSRRFEDLHPEYYPDGSGTWPKDPETGERLPKYEH